MVQHARFGWSAVKILHRIESPSLASICLEILEVEVEVEEQLPLSAWGLLTARPHGVWFYKTVVNSPPVSLAEENWVEIDSGKTWRL